MDHAVIPAPARFEAGAGPGFALRPGTVVASADSGIAPVARRFCAHVVRRTGLRLTPVRGRQVPGEPSVTIELGAPDDVIQYWLTRIDLPRRHRGLGLTRPRR